MEMMLAQPKLQDIWFKYLDYIKVKVRIGKVKKD